MDKFTDEQKEAMKQSAKEVLEDVKEVAKKAAKTAKPVTDAAKTTVAQAAKRVVMKPEVYVQFGQKETRTDELVQAAKAAYKQAGNRVAVRSLRVYVKPEESAAYYVINDDFSGKIAL